MKQLSNKVVVITGAGSGIGKALALQFIAENSVVALVDINDLYLQDLQTEIQQKGGKSSVHVADIGQLEAIKQLVKDVTDLHGRVDILVNNAGVSLARMPFHEIAWEQWEWMMKVNFWGTLHCTKCFFPLLAKQPEAHIVNVSSVFSLGGVAERSAYCASKFAVRGLTEALIQELRDTNISATSVLPGGVSTNIVKHCSGIQDKQLQQVLVARHQKNAYTTPPKAARRIIRAIKRKERRVLIGADARFMDFVIRYFRPYMDWILHLLVIKPEKEKIAREVTLKKAQRSA